MNAIMNALAWTFVHSLWQGLFAALLAALIISATGKSKARLRYNLLGMVLVIFLSTVIISFIFQFQQYENTSGVSLTIAEQGLANNVGENLRIAAPAGFTADISAWFNNNSDLFLLVWSLFFLIHCLKLITGMAAVNRLKYYRSHPVPAEWKLKLKELKDSLGIRQTICLMQSELIKIPVALGFLKPVILLPMGLLAKIPPEQVEAILLHELGHIRRKDFLVNFLQHFVEAVFFFNPGLVWISSLLRQEREACCDDIVIAKTGQKRNYLNALVSFQEYSLGYNSYAVGITGRKQHLFNRVKRILTNENKELGLFEKAALLSGLILFSAFTYMSREKPVSDKPRFESIGLIAQVPQTNNIEQKKSIPSTLIVMDTVPDNKIKLSNVKPKQKEKSLLTEKDRKLPTEKDWKKAAGKDLKLNTEKDPAKKAIDPKDVLNEIIEIKRKIGVRKEMIGAKKEYLKVVEGKNAEQEKAVIKAIEKERGELEGDRSVLEKKRALLEQLRSDDEKRKQKEKNDKPRVLFGRDKIERINDKQDGAGAGKAAGIGAGKGAGIGAGKGAGKGARVNLFLKKKPAIHLDNPNTLEFKLDNNLKMDKQEFQFKMNEPAKVIPSKLPPGKEKLQSPATPKMKTMPAKKAKI